MTTPICPLAIAERAQALCSGILNAVWSHYRISARTSRQAERAWRDAEKAVLAFEGLVPRTAPRPDRVRFAYERRPDRGHTAGRMPLELHCEIALALKALRAELSAELFNQWPKSHRMPQKLHALERAIDRLRCELDNRVCAEHPDAKPNPMGVYYGDPLAVLNTTRAIAAAERGEARGEA